MNILIVEDEAIIAMGLTWSLEDLGHTVVGPVRSSQDALDLSRRYHPALAFVDIGLQGPEDGIKLAEALLVLSIPTVFTSAHYALAWSHQDVALGLIGKPYSAAHISESMLVIETLLRGQTPTTRASALEVFARPHSAPHLALS